MPEWRKQLRTLYNNVRSCWNSGKKKLKKQKNLSTSGYINPDDTKMRIERGFSSGEARRQKDQGKEMIKDLQTAQNPKLTTGGVSFTIEIDKPACRQLGGHKPAPTELPRPLVDFNDEEKQLMAEICSMSKKKESKKVEQNSQMTDVGYNAEEKRAIADLMHNDILRVISQKSSPAKRQAKAAARRAEQQARASANTPKPTLTAKERRDRVKAMAAKNRSQAATSRPTTAMANI